MFVSVILSTYQHPRWLQRALAGYASQTRRPNEILVADDGSTFETAEVIEKSERTTGLRIVHVWHRRVGFRKCEILNQAVCVARGNYLVFSDGDCIPRRDFVETHYRLAQPGRFLSGGVLRLPLHLSQLADRSAIGQGSIFSLVWLLRNGFGLSPKLHLVGFHGKAATRVDQITPTRPTFNGHNTSAWKSDIVRANGFDERMGYGGLDRELGERLVNANIRGIQVRHRAVCAHLHHSRPYFDADVVARNRELRKRTVANGETWTEFGIHNASRNSTEPIVIGARIPRRRPAPVTTERLSP